MLRSTINRSAALSRRPRERNDMKSVAVGTLVVASLALPAVSPVHAQTVDGPVVEWKHSLWGKRRANTEGIEKVAEVVKTRTNGKFTIKIGYGEVYSKGQENLDGIKLGAFESADICNFYHPGKTPAWMAMSLPFVPISNLYVARDVGDAMIKHPAFAKDLEQWGAQAHYFIILPQSEFMGKGKAPKTLDDWKGLRVRAGGGLGDAMRILGAVPSTVPASEVYTAMERGTVDAAAFPHTYAHAAYQINTVSSWFTNNMNPSASGCAVVTSKAAYAKLPPQYQKLLQEAVPLAYQAMIDAYGKADAENLPVFRKRLTEILYTPEQLKEFQTKAGRPVWEKWVADNKAKFDAQNVLDTLLAETEKGIAKHVKK